jgi:hypothetical protein
MYILGLKSLSVSTLEDMWYAVMFEDGHALIRLERADTQDAVVRLCIKEGMLYRVLGQPVLGSKGILDRRSNQSAAEVARRSSSSKGAVTATTNLMGSEIDPGGGSSRSTYLAKEC